jgi:hypothetical protein
MLPTKIQMTADDKTLSDLITVTANVIYHEQRADDPYFDDALMEKIQEAIKLLQSESVLARRDEIKIEHQDTIRQYNDLVAGLNN